MEEGFSHLPVTPAHAMAVGDLPWHHRNPFDRILLAQALVEGLKLMSADQGLAPYRRWAIRV
ncbi:type II toxin-antitoxin system VapC family toxin [Thermus caliditerrae]|uniref:type II toxin-antitoxin system VapC family toxin n=1 Tax=Thermus caliditerrae TaxID=1330700 RepID=UPI001F23CCC6|nr:type II toxin-antitoxin system VapC family toxin [Thermus caliditerrae]